MRKLWIGLAAVVLLSFAVSVGRETVVRPAQHKQETSTGDPSPPKEDNEALMRLLLLIGLARRR
jgi:hypothetical protein